MNRGLVVGRVFNADRKPAVDPDVWIMHVWASGGELSVEKVEHEATSKGTFALPFLWEGADWALDFSAGVNILVGASTQEISGNHMEVTAMNKYLVKGLLRKDVTALTGIATPTEFGELDLKDFAIDIASELSEYRKLVPFWKRNLATTESWLIVAGANLYL